MKLSASNQRNAGYTVGEMMVAVGIASVVSVCAIYTLLNGMTLFAKNTAENLAHDQNRTAVNRLVHDIHAAVSIPQLGHIVSGFPLVICTTAGLTPSCAPLASTR